MAGYVEGKMIDFLVRFLHFFLASFEHWEEDGLDTFAEHLAKKPNPFN